MLFYDKVTRYNAQWISFLSNKLLLYVSMTRHVCLFILSFFSLEC
jgi:hypothetical protein